MENALKEAKAALAKSKDDMAKYYDRRRTPAPDYQPGDNVYLDASDIHTTRPSQKLSHRRLGPFTIVGKAGNSAYRLRCQGTPSKLCPHHKVRQFRLRLHSRSHYSSIYSSTPTIYPLRQNVVVALLTKPSRRRDGTPPRLLPYREIPLLLYFSIVLLFLLFVDIYSL